MIRIVIIGAGRSGTNMLRDLLVQLEGVATWPCDEINYVWRHGQKGCPHDELDSAGVGEGLRAFLDRQFDWVAKRYDAQWVVEKTCANSLRVPFVETVAGPAKYVFLVRDGMDAVASALERWKAPLDLGYVLTKARFVPKTDLPYYAIRYAWQRAYKRVSREKRVSSWGPRYRGMDEDLRTLPLEEVAARQWAACVQKAGQPLLGWKSESSSSNEPVVDPSRVHYLRYESFVREPAHHLQALAHFLGKPLSPTQATTLTQSVSPHSIGKAQKTLTPEQAERVRKIVETVKIPEEG